MSSDTDDEHKQQSRGGAPPVMPQSFRPKYFSGNKFQTARMNSPSSSPHPANSTPPQQQQSARPQGQQHTGLKSIPPLKSLLSSSKSSPSTHAQSASPGSSNTPQHKDSLFQQLDAENLNLWDKIASIHKKMYQFSSSRAVHQKVLSKYDSSRKASLYYDALFGLKRSPAQSIKSLMKLSSLNNPKGSNDSELHLTYRGWVILGFAHLQNESPESTSQALQAFHKAIRLRQQQHGPNEEFQDPILWYGIGIFYEKCDCLEDAEEAFSLITRSNPHFSRISEVYFRLALVFKRLQKYHDALECFGHLLNNPPSPLKKADIWLQIAHIYDVNFEWKEARDAYEEAIREDPQNAKVLQQYGWFLQNSKTPYFNNEQAIAHLKKSIDCSNGDPMTWYLLGRCFTQREDGDRLAFDAYQQAVLRQEDNPYFWCSIGILYYRINQHHDAVDAFFRAIKLNRNIPQVWRNLGLLYEKYNQIEDARNAFEQATTLENRKNSTTHGQNGPGHQKPPAPAPQHPHAQPSYAPQAPPQQQQHTVQHLPHPQQVSHQHRYPPHPPMSARQHPHQRHPPPHPQPQRSSPHPQQYPHHQLSNVPHQQHSLSRKSPTPLSQQPPQQRHQQPPQQQPQQEQQPQLPQQQQPQLPQQQQSQPPQQTTQPVDQQHKTQNESPLQTEASQSEVNKKRPRPDADDQSREAKKARVHPPSEDNPPPTKEKDGSESEDTSAETDHQDDSSAEKSSPENTKEEKKEENDNEDEDLVIDED